MGEYSMAALMLLVTFMNGGCAGGIEQRQSAPVLIPNLKHKNNDLQDQHFGNLKNPVLHVKGEKDPGEHLRPSPLKRMTRSTDKVRSACHCIHSEPLSVCSYGNEEFESIIIDGNCVNTSYASQGRSPQVTRLSGQGQNNVTMPMPPGFLRCESTRPLLLVSSGEKRSLHLGNTPAVWICPNSLGSPLQELVITNVSTVNISPLALAQRITDFTLIINDTSNALVFPQSALWVDAVDVQNVDDTFSNLMENVVDHRHLPQVKVLLENVPNVSFRTKSVLAPRVWVEVQQARTLILDTQAVEALASHSDSALHVTTTKLLRMKTRAAIVNSLRVIDTSMASLVEESVVMMAPQCEVILRRVEDVIAPRRAIILGGGAALELSDVFLPSKSDRAILSLSPLRSAMLRNVRLVGSNTTSICLATYALTLSGVTALSKESSVASVCLKYMTYVTETWQERSTVVTCEDSNMETTEHRLCSDPRCMSCRDPKLAKPPPAHRHAPTHLLVSEPSEVVEEDWWERPEYIALAVALAVLVLVLCFWGVYHTYRHCKHRQDSHEFPRTYGNGSGTFSRTIVTPDNLSSGAVEALLDGRYHQQRGPAHARH